METVLVVEDQESIRELIDLSLSSAGFKVVAVSSAESALDIIRRVHVDLALVDVHMPRMSGLDLLSALALRLRNPPPVIMLTADRNMGTVQEAMGRGCVGYISKPFDPSELVSRVRRVLAARIANKTGPDLGPLEI